MWKKTSNTSWLFWAQAEMLVHTHTHTCMHACTHTDTHQTHYKESRNIQFQDFCDLEIIMRGSWTSSADMLKRIRQESYLVPEKLLSHISSYQLTLKMFETSRIYATKPTWMGERSGLVGYLKEDLYMLLRKYRWFQAAENQGNSRKKGQLMSFGGTRDNWWLLLSQWVYVMVLQWQAFGARKQEGFAGSLSFRGGITEKLQFWQLSSQNFCISWFLQLFRRRKKKKK